VARRWHPQQTVLDSPLTTSFAVTISSLEPGETKTPEILSWCPPPKNTPLAQDSSGILSANIIVWSVWTRRAGRPNGALVSMKSQTIRTWGEFGGKVIRSEIIQVRSGALRMRISGKVAFAE